jgi:hypothetical protein
MTSKTSKFIGKANKVHNNIYNYSQVEYLYANTKIKIICNIHGEFLQRPADHLRGKGCSKCGHVILANKLKLSSKEFIEKANKVHNNIYDYSLVEYVNAYTKIKIMCNNHGEFLQKPTHHLCGHGCSKCIGNNNCSSKEFIEKANEIHNNIYNYSLVEYINARTKIKIICNDHGEFLQSPNQHLNGSGCTKCLYKNEQKVREIFEKIFEKKFLKIRIPSEHST